MKQGRDEMFVISDVIDDDADIVPLISEEDIKSINIEDIPDKLPILPLRNTVLFPGVVFPITVGRDKSISLIKSVYKGNRLLAG